jgi:asparagine synthase (glutamine-hydrolysing)
LSGFVGIANSDGAPVDRGMLSRMTTFLAFRGPDGQHMWTDGAAGLGHTLLKTTPESAHVQQPFSLDGRAWIVADARVDARRSLITKLAALGHELVADVSDVELILRAYSTWQERCVEHLLGDFAFAVWDAPRRRLFCARDHMGVKPLFYSCVGNSVIFSNTLDCIRLHPLVSHRLNDLAIADFLLFDLNQDKAATTFAEIRRVPPAHSATWAGAGTQLRRYWTLPIDEPIFYRKQGQYVEQFKELLQAAIADRLRIDRVGVFMSGGLDSSTLAATASDLLPNKPENPAVCAFTSAYDGYDDERYYAGLIARRLGIAIDFRRWDPQSVDAEWYRGTFHTPEPLPYPTSISSDSTYFRRVALHSRVVFYGEGPDNALRYEWCPYLSHLVRQRRFGWLLRDIGSDVISQRRIPLLATTLTKLKRTPPNDVAPSVFPDWFNPDLERRLGLRTRWQEFQANRPSPHPIRSHAYRSFDSPVWQAVFERFQPSFTNSLVEVRHPFLDIRLLRYMLAVPVVPWCRNKYLLRKAMRGLLPGPVLRRPKCPVVSDPWVERVLQCGLPPLIPSPTLEAYVDTRRLQGVTARDDRARFWVDFRTHSLAYWLRTLDPRGRAEDLVDASIRKKANTHRL